MADLATSNDAKSEWSKRRASKPVGSSEEKLTFILSTSEYLRILKALVTNGIADDIALGKKLKDIVQDQRTEKN